MLLSDLDSSGNLCGSICFESNERLDAKDRLAECNILLDAAQKKVQTFTMDGSNIDDPALVTEMENITALSQEVESLEKFIEKHPPLPCRPGMKDFYGMAEIIRNPDADPHDFIIHTCMENVDIIPGYDTLKLVDRELLRKADGNDKDDKYLRLLEKQFAKIEDEYDYCIIDCHPSEDMLALNALVCANEVIIPCTVNLDDIEGVLSVGQKAIDIYTSGLNRNLVVRGILITRVMTNKLDKEGITFTSNLPFKTFRTYIRNSVDVKRSRFNNTSIKEFNKNCSAAIDYDNFVAEYLGLQPVHPVAPYLIWPGAEGAWKAPTDYGES